MSDPLSLQDRLAAQRVQVMRTIDKYDRIGTQGVFDGLTAGRVDRSGDVLAGCGLSHGQALAVIHSLRLDEDAPDLRRRLHLMCAMDAIEIGGVLTLWDRFLSMPRCERDTWEDGKRPANVAFAVDDLWTFLAAKQAARENGP